MPPGLRKTLYIKDDDYLESYTHGNFITLTNLDKKDIEKIIKFKIEPLYISLHSFEPVVRELLFRTSGIDNGVFFFKLLDKNKIRTNIQIVVCPEINDGIDLINTLTTLINDFNRILSIGVVPVGITKYNKCSIVRSISREESEKIINSVKEFKEKNINNKNVKRIFLSDEFYLIAGKDLPSYKEYGNFLQIQNGIGKISNFLYEAASALKKTVKIKELKSCSDRNIMVVTSEYGYAAISKAIDILNNYLLSSNLHFKINPEVIKVKNHFFGGNVKVTGLLTGTDIMDSLNKINFGIYDNILIPDCIFNYNDLTLDNYSKDDFVYLSNKIKLIPEDGKSLIKNLLYYK